MSTYPRGRQTTPGVRQVVGHKREEPEMWVGKSTVDVIKHCGGLVQMSLDEVLVNVTISYHVDKGMIDKRRVYIIHRIANWVCTMPLGSTWHNEVS